VEKGYGTLRIQHNSIDFENLQFRRYALKDLYRNLNHPVHGLDTETYKGYAKLLAMEDGDYVLCNSIEDVLTFLTQAKLRVHHNFYYNVRFDFQALFKYLPEDLLRELYFTSKTVYEDYKIKYIPKKLFRILHKKHSYLYYDLAQFYEMSLAEASMKYISDKKNKENINRSRLNTDAKYWKKRKEDIIKYCISDASLTQRLGVFLQAELKSKLSFTPQKYISKASISKEYFRKRCKIPSISGIPLPVLSFAFNAYHGGRFEILQRGFFDYTTLIDINSAYPYHIANLIDITGSKWVRVRECDESATYGFYMCKVFIPFMTFAPFAFRLPNNRNIYPIGEHITFLTIEEIRAYKNICSIEVIEGYETHIDNPTYPFKEAMQKLFDWKLNTPKDDFRYDLVKKVMNALGGCFYEKVKYGNKYRVGQFFNPLYASTVLGDTRIDVFEKAKEYEEDVIGFATDSVLLNGKHDIKETKELGGWSIDGEGKAVVLRSGVYQIAEKVKSRGLSRSTNLLTPDGKFKNIFTYIKAFPDRTKYKIILNRPVNLGEALIHTKKRSIADINVWKDFEYVVDINRDSKREWYDTFNCGKELFERHINSTPILIKGDIVPKMRKADIAASKRRTTQQRIEIRESEERFDIDSRATKKREQDEEIINEMKKDLKQEAYFLENM